MADKFLSRLSVTIHAAGHLVVKIDRARSTAADLVAGRPQPLLAGPGQESLSAGTVLEPTRDGQRFLVAYTPEESRPRTLRVVVNWFSAWR